MKEKHIGRNESKGIFYGELEEYARGKIREHLQDLLEQEVSEWLGREKSERKVHPLEQPGYRNGYGKRRRFAYSAQIGHPFRIIPAGGRSEATLEFFS